MSEEFRAVIIGENFAESGTFSGGSWNASYPLTNSQSRDFGVVSRSSNALAASTIMKIDLGREEQIGGVAVCCINWSRTATVRLMLSTFSDYSTLSYDSGFTYVPGFVVSTSLLPSNHPDADDGVLNRWIPDEIDRHYIHVISEDDEADAWARYVQIQISDTSNSDGYLEHGYVMVGAALRPSINYGEGNGLGLTHLTDATQSLGGQMNFNERADIRTWSAGFRYLSNRELYGNAFRMKIKARDSRPVVVVPDPTDTLNFQVRSFVARMREMSAIEQIVGMADLGAVNFVFEEWK